jgi:hypothetical protein
MMNLWKSGLVSKITNTVSICAARANGRVDLLPSVFAIKIIWQISLHDHLHGSN